MRKVLLFGNSRSGKSTLANEFKNSEGLAHLDLDELAWLSSNPPKRAPLGESLPKIMEFTQCSDAWVIEGCYSDLLEVAVPEANEIVFLNLPVDLCIENTKNREWEPHKYPSKEKQDDNLEMLFDWISDYEHRNDVFSRNSHLKLYHSFIGKKTMFTSNARDI